MTTSHVKPIIASHHQDTLAGVASLPVENNVSVLQKSTSSSFKRVSFGNAKGTVVETFIYESVPTIEEGSYYGPASPSGSYTHHTREPVDYPPSKVKVKTLESQTPLYIPPPSTVASVGVTKLNNGGAAGVSGSGGVLIVEKRNLVNQTSPLPSLQKMDEETDNPFRPDGRLSHEVEPIVECYKKRPFPHGAAGLDYTDGVAVTNVGPSSKSPPSSPAGKKVATSASSSSPPTQSSKNGSGNREAALKPQDIKLTLTTADGLNSQLEVQHKQLTSPKAGHVEVVHIGEKRKRCACCTIQ